MTDRWTRPLIEMRTHLKRDCMQDSSTAAAALTVATTAHVDAPAAATKIAIDSEAFLGLSADIRERKLSSISSPVIVTINESACASVWGHMTVKRTNERTLVCNDYCNNVLLLEPYYCPNDNFIRYRKR